MTREGAGNKIKYIIKLFNKVLYKERRMRKKTDEAVKKVDKERWRE